MSRYPAHNLDIYVRGYGPTDSVEVYADIMSIPIGAARGVVDTVPVILAATSDEESSTVRSRLVQGLRDAAGSIPFWT